MLQFFALSSGRFLGLSFDVLEPFAQGVDHAVVDHLFAAHIGVEVVEFIDRGADFLDGFAVVFVGMNWVPTARVCIMIVWGRNC